MIAIFLRTTEDDLSQINVKHLAHKIRHATFIFVVYLGTEFI